MESSSTEFIVQLSILFAAAVLAGEVATRLGQAALVGQLIVGVLLGPTLVGPYLGLTTFTPELSALQFLATFFILFMAGLSITPDSISQMGWRNGALGVGIFVVPFVVGAGVVDLLFPGLPRLTVLFVALTLSITALPVMALMVEEFALTERPLGRMVMNAALVNELAAVTVFAVLLQLSSGHTPGPVAVGIAVAATALFIATMLLAHMLLLLLRQGPAWRRLQQRFVATWRTREAGFAVLMMMALASALYSQYLGLTFVVGAFYAGLLVTRESAGPAAHRAISTTFGTVTWGFFVPLFFVFVGVEIDLHLLASVLDVLVLSALLVVAVMTKLLTGGALARAFGWSGPSALATGFLATSRGAVELAMAVILLSDGIFTPTLFAYVATVGLVATVIAPMGARWAWGARGPRRDEAPRAYRTEPRPLAATTSARPAPAATAPAASPPDPPTPAGGASRPPLPQRRGPPPG